APREEMMATGRGVGLHPDIEAQHSLATVRSSEVFHVTGGAVDGGSCHRVEPVIAGCRRETVDPAVEDICPVEGGVAIGADPSIAERDRRMNWVGRQIVEVLFKK